MKSVKLSDFIDEDFVADLVKDIDEKEVERVNDNRKPLNDFISHFAQKSTVTLPTMQK